MAGWSAPRRRCGCSATSVPLMPLVDWTADQVGRGMPSLGKDTHYDTRDGNFSLRLDAKSRRCSSPSWRMPARWCAKRTGIQLEADWRIFLDLGRVYAVHSDAGRIVATRDLAVQRPFRLDQHGAGCRRLPLPPRLAARLMRRAMDDLAAAKAGGGARPTPGQPRSLSCARLQGRRASPAGPAPGGRGRSGLLRAPPGDRRRLPTPIGRRSAPTAPRPVAPTAARCWRACCSAARRQALVERNGATRASYSAATAGGGAGGAADRGWRRNRRPSAARPRGRSLPRGASVRPDPCRRQGRGAALAQARGVSSSPSPRMLFGGRATCCARTCGEVRPEFWARCSPGQIGKASLAEQDGTRTQLRIAKRISFCPQPVVSPWVTDLVGSVARLGTRGGDQSADFGGLIGGIFMFLSRNSLVYAILTS